MNERQKQNLVSTADNDSVLPCWILMMADLKCLSNTIFSSSYSFLHKDGGLQREHQAKVSDPWWLCPLQWLLVRIKVIHPVQWCINILVFFYRKLYFTKSAHSLGDEESLSSQNKEYYCKCFKSTLSHFWSVLWDSFGLLILHPESISHLQHDIIGLFLLTIKHAETILHGELKSMTWTLTEMC